jgi:hypothetical protein
VLEKIEKFEKKTEFNRFLLILNVAGFVTIIGGLISYVVNRFLGVDPTFFIFNMTNDPDLSPSKEPVLFLSIWIIYLIPIVSVIILSAGSTGILSWNKSYRSMSILLAALFFLVHILILLVGMENARLIPLIWGITVGAGFLLSRNILIKQTSDRIVRLGLVFFGSYTILVGIIASFLIPADIGQLFFGFIVGITLSLCGLIGYYGYGRVN